MPVVLFSFSYTDIDRIALNIENFFEKAESKLSATNRVTRESIYSATGSIISHTVTN